MRTLYVFCRASSFIHEPENYTLWPNAAALWRSDNLHADAGGAAGRLGASLDLWRRQAERSTAAVRGPSPARNALGAARGRPARTHSRCNALSSRVSEPAVAACLADAQV